MVGLTADYKTLLLAYEGRFGGQSLKTIQYLYAHNFHQHSKYQNGILSGEDVETSLQYTEPILQRTIGYSINPEATCQ